jgi:hypothetical protein
VDFPFREWERISTAIHIDQPVRKYLFATILFINRLYELSTTYPLFAFSEHAKIIKFRARTKSVKPSRREIPCKQLKASQIHLGVR